MKNMTLKNIIKISIIFIPVVSICFYSSFSNNFNIILLILGFLFLIAYLFFIYGEIVISKNSNTNHFNVQSDGNNLIIDYKNDRFNVPIDSFNYIDDYYKKATGKNMNIIKKEGIINSLKRDYWYYIKKIPKENLMNENSVLNYFSNIKEGNEEDKKILLDYIDAKELISSKIPEIFIFSFLVLIIFGGCLQAFFEETYLELFIGGVFALLILALIIVPLKKIFSFINITKQIKNNRLFITDCFLAAEVTGFPKDTVNDKIIEAKYLSKSKNKNCYEVIIRSESGYYLNKWFATPSKAYTNLAKLYIINNQKNNTNEYILITK